MNISVGISAFNEEHNIKTLIIQILNQNMENHNLTKIIIVSDCSTDDTVRIIKNFEDKRIMLIKNKKRMGKSLSLNTIVKKFDGDALVILDADISLKSERFLAYLINPLIKNKQVGIVSARTIPLTSRTFLEKVINFSILMKQEIFEALDDGNNIFFCHGRARAFSNDFLRKFKWISTSGEDAYSYLQCMKNGFKFTYAKNAIIYYRSPQTFVDQIRQSARYFSSRKKHEKYFSTMLDMQNFKFPIEIFLKKGLKYFYKQPLYFCTYLIVVLVAKIYSTSLVNKDGVWNISETSKKL